MEPDVKIAIEFVGPAAIHNLLCWLCNERHAVYDMYPNWCFRPCWHCQSTIKPPARKSRWKFWDSKVHTGRAGHTGFVIDRREEP